MEQEREQQGETTESTERIPPGSMPPDESGAEPADDEKADEKADQESKESFPASDPPSW